MSSSAGATSANVNLPIFVDPIMRRRRAVTKAPDAGQAELRRLKAVVGAMNIGAWLRGLGLERYEPVFRDNDIDAEVLPELTADDLIALGVPPPVVTCRRSQACEALRRCSARAVCP